MEKQYTAYQTALAGTPGERGRALAELARGTPLLEGVLRGVAPLGERKLRDAQALFDAFCPGVNEEIAAFAEAVRVQPADITYYAMTYLVPRCSQMVLLPAMTREGRILHARNYEFSDRMESFLLLHTRPAGKYAHVGTDVLLFGRQEGLNECGLAVSMSACGIPMGPLHYMRAPQMDGLQFWGVIRAVLENCRDVEDARRYLAEMPIAANFNLMLSDKGGHAAVLETQNGEKAMLRVEETGRNYLLAANHPCVPAILAREPRAMRHSLRRYEALEAYLKDAAGVTAEDLQALLLKDYPDGPCCHFFSDFFGTTTSVVMDVGGGTLDLCWGGEAANGWRQYRVDTPPEPEIHPIMVRDIPMPGELKEYVAL